METFLEILISAILVTTLCSGSLDDFEPWSSAQTNATTEEPLAETDAPTSQLTEETDSANTVPQTELQIRLRALIPDLENLRLFWSKNVKEQKRPARIEFGPDEEILVRYEYEPFNSITYLDDWGRGFLLLDFGINDHDQGEANTVYYSHGSFYTRNDSSSNPLPVSNEDFWPIFPMDRVWNTPEILIYASPQIRVTYIDLKTLGDEIDNHEHFQTEGEVGLFSNQSNELLLKYEKSAIVLVRHVTVLSREVGDNQYNDVRFDNITESAHHAFIRYDKKKRIFLTEKNELLKDTYLVRPSTYVIKETCTRFRNFLSSWFNQRGYC